MISRGFILNRLSHLNKNNKSTAAATTLSSAFLASTSRFCASASTSTEETGAAKEEGGEEKQQQERTPSLFPHRRFHGFVKDNVGNLSFAQKVILLKRHYRGMTNSGTSAGDLAVSDALALLNSSVPHPVQEKDKFFKEWLGEENASLFLNAVRFFSLSGTTTTTAAVAPRPQAPDASLEEKEKMKADYLQKEKEMLQLIDIQKAAVEQWLVENVCEFKDPYYRVSGALTLLQYSHSATPIQEMLVKKLVPRVIEGLPDVAFGVFEQSLRLLHWCEMTVGDEAESPTESEKNKKIWEQVAAVVRQRENEIGNKIVSMTQTFNILVHYVPEHEVVKDLCDTLFEGIAHLTPHDLSSFAMSVEIYGRATLPQIKELIGRYSTKVRSNSAEDLKRSFPAIARIALHHEFSSPTEVAEVRDLMQVVLDESESQICSFMDSNFRLAYVSKNPEDVARIIFAYESFGRPSLALLKTYAKYIENNFAAGKMTPHCAALTLGVLSRTRCLTESLALQCSHYISNELLSKKSMDGGFFFNLEEAGYCALGLSGFKSCEATVVALQKHILSNWSKAVSGSTFTTNYGRAVPMLGRSDFARQNAALTTAVSLCRVHAANNTIQQDNKTFVAVTKPLLEVFSANSKSEIRTLQLVQLWNALVVAPQQQTQQAGAAAAATAALPPPHPSVVNPSLNPVYSLLLNTLKKRLSDPKTCLNFGAVELRLLCATSHRNPAITREIQYCINEYLNIGGDSNSSTSGSNAQWSATTLDFLKYSSKLDKSGFARRAVQTARQLAVTGAQFIHFFELLSDVFPNNADVQDFGRNGSLQLLKVDRFAAFNYIELARVKKSLRPNSKEFPESVTKYILPSGPHKMNFAEICNTVSLLALALKFNFVPIAAAEQKRLQQEMEQYRQQRQQQQQQEGATPPEKSTQHHRPQQHLLGQLLSRALQNVSTNSPITCHSSSFSSRELLRDLLKSVDYLCANGNSSADNKELTEEVTRVLDHKINEAAKITRLLEVDIKDNVLMMSYLSKSSNGGALKDILKQNVSAPLFVAPPQIHNFSNSASSSSTTTEKKKAAAPVVDESLKAEGKGGKKAAATSTSSSSTSNKKKPAAPEPKSSAKKSTSSSSSSKKDDKKKPAPAAKKASGKKAAPPAKKKGKK